MSDKSEIGIFEVGTIVRGLSVLSPEEQQGAIRAMSPERAAAVQERLAERFERADGAVIEGLLSADSVMGTDWPEPTWAIPNYLPVGLTILAGKPKVGKSWLSLQIALAVGAGGQTLGEPVEGGPVLYLALEDTARRLKDRMGKQGWPRGLPVEFMTLGQFYDSVGDLQNGGGIKLADQIDLKRYRLVVIDTLSRSVMGDQNDVAAMTAALTPLQEISHHQNTAILLNDHHHKGNLANPDAISDILGSTAKGAMADTVWGLYRERGKLGAKLAITGRDVEEHTLALTIDWDLGCWQCDGDADQLEVAERHMDIIAYLEDAGQAGVTAIAEAVDRNKGGVYKDLQDLANNGTVKRTGGGRGKVKYELASQELGL